MINLTNDEIETLKARMNYDLKLLDEMIEDYPDQEWILARCREAKEHRQEIIDKLDIMHSTF